ncbi:VOC family protein [Desulfatitalea tepidiphila]|uniref:VOC family protein n=1 Tax=Desulfatitalea tepidiphila TaxID=1185843 RepID=UPI0006B52278|nr:VOC family protein [Desulfatitalea tepidiphila]
MPTATKHRFAHVCILVKDIDTAIEHYTRILKAVAPQMLEEKVVKQEGHMGNEHYLTAFFPAAGDACDIQLLQPVNADSAIARRLAEHGEGVHHIAFTTGHLEDTFRELKEQKVQLHGDNFLKDGSNSKLQLIWIHPKYAHGVLIEVMNEYRLEDGLIKEVQGSNLAG